MTWGWASSSKIAKEGPTPHDTRKSFSVNDEYLHAFRTESYIKFFTKAQLLVGEPSSSPSTSPSPSTMDILLEPEQHLVPPMLEAFSKHSSDLKPLMLRYFDTSAQASGICSKLLTSINETHSDYRFIQRALNRFSHCSSPDQYSSAISELDSFAHQRNPFSNTNPENFKQICDNFSSILRRLKSKRKKVTHRIKLIEFIKKALGVCLTLACSASQFETSSIRKGEEETRQGTAKTRAMAAIGIAVHSATGPVMAPAILGTSPVQLKKKFWSLNCLKRTSLRKLREQLDVAAKGTYILDGEFDTVSRIVARLHDEVEHKKEMIRFCLERREDKFPLEEVVKEFRRNGGGFRRQVEELEEHVCLCLVSINRARLLVIKEMSKT